MSRAESLVRCVCLAAGYLGVPTDEDNLRRQYSVYPVIEDWHAVTALRSIGLKAKLTRGLTQRRLAVLPTPSLLIMNDGDFVIFGGMDQDGRCRVVDAALGRVVEIDFANLRSSATQAVVLLQRSTSQRSRYANFGWSWFIGAIWRYRLPLATVLAASAFLQVIALSTPLALQVIIDKVLVHGSSNTLGVVVAVVTILTLVEAILHYLRSYNLAHTTSRIDVELGFRLFSKLLSLPVSYFEQRAAGQTIARVREIESIRSFLTGQGLFAAIDLVFCIVFFGVLSAYSLPLLGVVAASLPVYAAIGLLFGPVLKHSIDLKFDTGARSQQLLVESISGITTIKSLTIERELTHLWEERLAAFVRAGFGVAKVASLAQSSVQLTTKLSSIAVIYFGAKLVIAGDLSVGGLVAFNMIAGQISLPILRLSQLWQEFQQTQTSVERLGDVLNALSESGDGADVVQRSIPKRVTLNRVRFRYQEHLPDVLDDVSVDFEPGEIVGIIGRSGSGKSTIAKLLQRFHEPTAGQISIGGHDIRNMNVSALRRLVGVVQQDSFLFNRSIAENITAGRANISRKEIMEAAILAGADEFITKLQHGYDTLLEERGVNLSGGQRQRIAIARALVTDPTILVFDEATSALDYESENIIRSNLGKMASNRTMIIIAHRLSTVRDCSRIFCMENGRVVDVGSHDEFLKRPNSLYSRLWHAQSGQQ